MCLRLIDMHMASFSYNFQLEHAVISDVEEGEEASEEAAKPKKGKRRAMEKDPKKLFAGKRLEWG